VREAGRVARLDVGRTAFSDDVDEVSGRGRGKWMGCGLNKP
jgi:hypothetical protein